LGREETCVPKAAESYHEENSRRREHLGNYRGSTRITTDRTIFIQDDFALIRVHPRKSAVKVSGLLSRRRRALGLAGAHGAAARAKTTAAWAFTDVAGGAGASTGLDCIRSGAQLAQGKRAGGKSGCEHRGEH
jgi:hypothetical protein